MAESELETRLRASQVYNRNLIEACPAALFVVTPELEITDVNEEATRAVGLPRRELIGTGIRDHLNLTPEAVDALRRTLDTGASAQISSYVTSPAGNPRTLALGAARFYDPNGDSRGVFVALPSRGAEAPD